MGSKGDCFDNAVAESFFATLKKELVHRQSWPTRRELTSEVFEYIEGFYNRTRRHSTLGMLPRRLREDHKHKQQQLGKANQASTSPRKRGKTNLWLKISRSIDLFKRGYSGAVKLHEAIDTVLADRPVGMYAREIADEINRRGLYTRGDGEPLPMKQIYSRISNETYRDRYRRDEAGRICLA
jgi:hypothetical protein